MATNSFKRLAGVDLDAMTEVKIGGPGSGKAWVGELYICNLASSSATYRVYATDTDAASATEDAIAYDRTLPANDTHTLTFHLANPHTIRGYASATTVTMVMMGNEITV